MSNLAIVSQVKEVQDHPNEEKSHLGVFILHSGAQLIGVNNEDGSRRFQVGDLLIHVKPGSIIPQKIIDSGFDNVKGGKIKASNFSGVKSEGIMLNLKKDYASTPHIPDDLHDKETTVYVALDDDVTEILGIKSA